MQTVDESARVTLHGYVHPLANAANDRGAAPDSMPLERMHLVLKRSASQEAALQQLIADMHTPGNANYHKWLTPDAFGKQFGPSDQDIATVKSWLSSHGFQVAGTKPGRQVIEFTGNAAQFREAFRAPIHQYMVKGNLHYAAASDPEIPAAIAPVVGGFVSLNNFRPKQYAHVLGQATYDPNTHTAAPIAPNWTYGSSQAQYYVLSPADFAVQYDVNPLYQAGIDGRGEIIAIINESNINLDLVQQFRKQFLPNYSATNLPTVVIDGNDPGIDGVNNPDGPNYAANETYIDVEWAGAVAPNASVDLVIAADTNLESGLYLAAERAIYSDVAPIMSLSFGACESALGSTNAYLNDLWEQAAAEGITVVVSAGDNGSAGCDDFNSQEYAVHGLAVSGFASTPWNVAVGGTDFYYSDYSSGGASVSNFWSTTATQAPAASMKSPIQEQPWNDSQFGLNIQSIYQLSGKTQTSIAGGSGGASGAALCSAGYSSSTGACSGTLSGYAKPAWQTGTGVPADKVRDLPDVSLFAADGLNYSFYPFCYADGDCQPASGSNLMQISGAGGTSFGAPAFAGIMALIDQKYGPQGQADVVLYPLKAQFPAAFHDVTVGSNAEPCNTTTVGAGFQSYPPVNCIAAPSGLGYTIADPTYGQTVEGELGTSSGPGYNAAAGYNLATGLGTIDANALVNDWGNVKFTSSSITMTASSTSITHGQSVTISGSVTGSGTVTGNVALMSDSPQTAQQGANFGQVLAGSASTLAVSNGAYT
ncbi:MAG TPA: S53 family peptidase, partial [Acidobacteriaceae bacterium]|nr:S53 family peptidase [Acidobacteriaceae bacterium]